MGMFTAGTAHQLQYYLALYSQPLDPVLWVFLLHLRPPPLNQDNCHFWYTYLS